MTTPIVFLDTETDGLHPGHVAWEVAMIRRDAAGQRRMEFFVDIDMSRADPFALSVGRFYERHPRGKQLSGQAVTTSSIKAWASEQTQSEAAAALMIAQWTHGAHVVGAIPSYDLDQTLDPLLRRHGLLPAWHHHIVDVEAMAYGWLSRDGHKIDLPYKSDDLSLALGVPEVPDEKRHTAMGDAEWVMAMYDAMTGGAA